MDKRYQVFVSSTYDDLADERGAAIQAILGLEHLPAGMEMFPAANEDQWTLIKRVIDESDYYVVVVGGRYGSMNAEGISYTEREYDYAIETKTPVIGFLHKDPERIEAGKTDQNDEARAKLAEFRTKVEGRPVKYFTSAAELGGHVALSLVALTRKEPGIGWVRGDKAMTVETEREMLELRQRLAKAEAERESAQSALVEDTSELAQGTDEVTIPVVVSGQKKTENWQQYKATVDAQTTWDELFGDIGPIMIDEAIERDVRQRAAYHALAMVDGETRAAFADWSNLNAKIYNEDWDMIRVQLRALGLIDKGQKKRPINDDNKYLSLTDKGDRHLIFLRAVRRGVGHDPGQATPTQTD